MQISEPEVKSFIEAKIVDWLQGSGLRDSFAPQFPAAVTWVVTCSPKDASVEQLALATMDLHLWFLYLDDYAESDYAEFYRRLERVISGEHWAIGPGKDEVSRVLRQFVDHTDRLAARGLSMNRYVSERMRALDVYEVRNRNNEIGHVATFDEFLGIREITTLFRLWYTLWEILGGFQISGEEYSTPVFDRAINATTRWHVFINEIHSLSRDMEAGMPNLVLCLERDRGMSRDNAIAFLRRGCDEFEDELRAARKEAKDRGLDVGNLRVAFEFLNLNIEGGRELYRRDLARYQPLSNGAGEQG